MFVPDEKTWKLHYEDFVFLIWFQTLRFDSVLVVSQELFQGNANKKMCIIWEVNAAEK